MRRHVQESLHGCGRQRLGVADCLHKREGAAAVDASQWFEQLFHLAAHVSLLLALYAGSFKLAASMRKPMQGAPRMVEGESVRVQTYAADGRLREVHLEFEVPAGLRFVLRRENSFDRLAKVLRLIQEQQLGDAHFDRSLFLEVPGSLADLAKADPKALRWIVALSQRMEAVKARFYRMEARDGRLRLRLLGQPGLSSADPVVRNAVQWMQAPLAGLRALAATPPTDSHAPLFWHQYAWLFMLTAGAGLLLLHFGNEHVEGHLDLARASAWLACVLLVLWYGWLARRFDLRSTRHQLLTAMLLLAWPLLWAFSALLLRQANMIFDTHPPTIVALESASLVVFNRRKLQDGFEVVYTLPDGRQRARIIGPWRYQQWHQRWPGQTSKPLQLRQHRGALGIAWAEVVEIESVP